MPPQRSQPFGLKTVSPLLNPSAESLGSASKSAEVSSVCVLQRSQSTRTSRWAITARSVDFSRKASTPRSMSLRHRRSRCFGVQRCQHEMTGQRRVNGDARSLRIAHFADHDDVGILSNERAHRRGEGQTDRGLHLRLIDPGDFVFDRIFDRQDLARWRIERREHGRKRRRLAASRRAGDRNQAVGQIEQTPDRSFVAGARARASRMSSRPRSRGNRRMTAASPCWVGMVATRMSISARAAQSRRAVLRQTAFRDVESGENLDPRNERLRQHVRRRRHARASRPSTRMRTLSPLRNGSIWMSLARSSTALSMQVVDRAHNRGAAREVAQIVDVLIGAAGLRCATACGDVGGVKRFAQNGRDIFERSD